MNIPAQDNIPNNAFVRSHRVVERDGAIWIWIWIWMGDPQRADPAQIVSYPHHNHGSGWAYKRGYSHIAAWYELLHDNLLDLTHIGWVHQKTIGRNAQASGRAPTKTERQATPPSSGGTCRARHRRRPTCARPDSPT